MDSNNQFYPFSYQGKHQQAAEQWTHAITQITLGYHQERLSFKKAGEVKTSDARKITKSIAV